MSSRCNKINHVNKLDVKGLGIAKTKLYSVRFHKDIEENTDVEGSQRKFAKIAAISRGN